MKFTGIKEAAQRWNESYKAGRFEPYSNWRIDVWVDPETGKVSSEEFYGNTWTTKYSDQVIVELLPRLLSECKAAEARQGLEIADLRKTATWLRRCVLEALDNHAALASH